MKKADNKTHLRKDLFYTFDIETTTLITDVDADGNAVRNGIIWSGQFYDGVNYDQVRSLEEVVDYLKRIELREADKPFKVCVFVHNLSFEFSYIKDFFKWEKILATSTRKIISAETSKLVFRCSYVLSNMSLEKFLQSEHVPEEFQKTKMDYATQRFPWTPISEVEYIYCKNDVVGLHMAISHRVLIEHDGDINKLPMTSTGYVRRDCRKAVSANPSNRYRFYNEKLDLDTYKMLRKAFRGGNTHSNKEHTNKVMYHVAGADESSAYPWELMVRDYPSKFYDLKPYTQKEFDFYLQNWEKWALLIEVSWSDLELINERATPVPYIPTSKCDRLLFNNADKRPAVDNGRVLHCKYCSMTITEVDYILIKNQYKWSAEKITRVKVAKKKPICKELKAQIMAYYNNKTTMKQDENDPNYSEEIAYFYGKSKNLLNGIYGMHVTDPIKQDYYFDTSSHTVKQKTEDESQLLEEYYNSFSSFLSYQVGVWVTCYARMDLQAGIDLLTIYDESGMPLKSDLVYCDTDSCKYLNPEAHAEAFEKLNAERKALADKCGAYADYKGKRYYLGVFADEGISEKFLTFGAKKYMCGSDDHFKITISGVNKKDGVKAIQKAVECGRFKSPFDLRKGFVFHGIKLTACYNDYIEIRTFETPEGVVKYGSNVALYPTPYTLGMTEAYEYLLDEYKEYME